MRCLVIYSGKDEQSHARYTQIRIDLSWHSTNIHRSRSVGAREIFFFEYNVKRESISPWHNSSYVAYIIQLSGDRTFETSDGKKYPIASGDVLLMKDIVGKGHRTHVRPGHQIYAAVVLNKPNS